MKHMTKITALALIFFHQHVLCMSPKVWKVLDKKTKGNYIRVKETAKKELQKNRFKKLLETMNHFDDASYEQKNWGQKLSYRYDLNSQP